MNEKRYYWLKLEENYFDLKVQKALRKLPSGSDMLICYLKMQLKYLNKGGLIEFQGIYDELSQEIALDIDEDEDLVKMTLSILTKWKVIDPSEDGLYITEMQERIGSKSDIALRVAKHREKQKMLHCNNDVTKCNSIKEIDIEKEIDIDIEKDKDKEIDLKEEKKKVSKDTTHRFKKPTFEEVKSYCDERCNNINPQHFIDFYESKGWKVGNQSMKDWKACIRTWETKDKKFFTSKLTAKEKRDAEFQELFKQIEEQEKKNDNSRN